ncbi:MAG: tyrosine-type recombinase/integrase [Proteobacteria bacterium]|nr:tyrosine-type recombinase/integrase [Pseudomonadota bacterium]
MSTPISVLAWFVICADSTIRQKIGSIGAVKILNLSQNIKISRLHRNRGAMHTILESTRGICRTNAYDSAPPFGLAVAVSAVATCPPPKRLKIPSYLPVAQSPVLWRAASTPILARHRIHAMQPHALSIDSNVSGCTATDIDWAQMSPNNGAVFLSARPTMAVGFPFNFHNLRHKFAIEYLKAGGGIYDLQKILDHASIKTTEGYLDYVDTTDGTKHGTGATVSHPAPGRKD